MGGTLYQPVSGFGEFGLVGSGDCCALPSPATSVVEATVCCCTEVSPPEALSTLPAICKRAMSTAEQASIVLFRNRRSQSAGLGLPQECRGTILHMTAVEPRAAHVLLCLVAARPFALLGFTRRLTFTSQGGAGQLRRKPMVANCD